MKKIFFTLFLLILYIPCVNASTITYKIVNQEEKTVTVDRTDTYFNDGIKVNYGNSVYLYGIKADYLILDENMALYVLEDSTIEKLIIKDSNPLDFMPSLSKSLNIGAIQNNNYNITDLEQMKENVFSNSILKVVGGYMVTYGISGNYLKLTRVPNTTRPSTNSTKTSSPTYIISGSTGTTYPYTTTPSKNTSKTTKVLTTLPTTNEVLVNEKDEEIVDPPYGDNKILEFIYKNQSSLIHLCIYILIIMFVIDIKVKKRMREQDRATKVD